MVSPRRALRSSLSLASVLGAIALVVLTFPTRPPLAQSELVIHKEGTSFYHRPGCPIVRDGVGVLALSRGQAHARGFKPHPDCDPANAKPVGSATSHASPSRSARTVPPATKVYVDGQKYYHRKHCSRLVGNDRAVKAVSLDVAARTHWPCPTCKAPILKRNTEPAVPGTDRRRGG